MTERNHQIAWRHYIKLTFESLLAFYIATFCVGLFFMHRGTHWGISGFCLLMLYAFVIFVCGRRLYQHTSLAALFLIIPIAPFIALAMILSLIPLLEYLK